MLLFGGRQDLVVIKINSDSHGNLVDPEPPLAIDHGFRYDPQPGGVVENLLRDKMSGGIPFYLHSVLV